MAPRPGPFARLIELFHTPPYGRWLEIGFWAILAAITAGVGWLVYVYPNEPLAYLVWLVAACMLLFGLLPQRRPKTPPPAPPKGKRGQIAEQVKASKAEKRKGPPPPIQ